MGANREQTDAARPTGDEAARGEPSIDATSMLRLLIENVDEYAIFVLDPHGFVASWNIGAARMKGYTASEVIGRHFSIFYTSEDINGDKPGRLLADAQANGRSRDQGWRVRKDGSQFWGNVVITPLIDGDELIGFAKITRDETDRKETEERVRQMELIGDRERIALELNQTVVHRIFEAGILLQASLRMIRDDEGSKRVNEAIDHLDDTLKELRAAIVQLEPRW